MATKDFKFDEYNKVLENAGPGLKLFLAEQLLTQVQASMVYFNNPLHFNLADTVNEIKKVRVEGKKQAAVRAANQERSGSSDALENAGDTEAIDNATVPGGAMTKPSNSADAGKVNATK